MVEFSALYQFLNKAVKQGKIFQKFQYFEQKVKTDTEFQNHHDLKIKQVWAFFNNMYFLFSFEYFLIKALRAAVVLKSGVNSCLIVELPYR